MIHAIEDHEMYMSFARLVAERSVDQTMKVGCVLVRGQSVLSYGWNGMPEGMPNEMEYPTLVGSNWDGEYRMYMRMRTRPEVMHAELSMLRKLLQEGISTKGATLYTTLSPCMNHHCASMIKGAGIIQVVYEELYKDTAGIDYLTSSGVYVQKLSTLHNLSCYMSH
jgi:dCMP deaminase